MHAISALGSSNKFRGQDLCEYAFGCVYYALFVLVFVCMCKRVPLVLVSKQGKEFYKIFHYIKLADERSENEHVVLYVCVCCFFLCLFTLLFLLCISENNDKNFHTKRHLHTLSRLMLSLIRTCYMFSGYGQWHRHWYVHIGMEKKRISSHLSHTKTKTKHAETTEVANK